MSTIVDWSDELSAAHNDAKSDVEQIINRFDIECNPSKTKHYPVSYFCNGSPEEIATALELINNRIWSTVQQRVFVDSYQAIVNSTNVKIGKIYVSCPDKLSYVSKELKELKAFAFGYPFEDSYEVKGEINFVIELY